MELICSNDESITAKLKQLEEYCKWNDITVNIKTVTGRDDIRTIQIDDKTCTVVILDDKLVDLLENCGKTVSRMLKITSKPNKLIYMKCVADDKMEMFDALYKNCVNTEEELIKVYRSKSPAEYDETTNTCATLQSLSLQPADKLSENSLNESIVGPTTSVIQQERKAVESIHSFNSCDSAEERKEAPCVVQRSKSDQNLNNPTNMRVQQSQDSNGCSLPNNFQSVITHNLYPNTSGLSSYVDAGLSHTGSHLQSQTPTSRPLNVSDGVESGMPNGQFPQRGQCLSFGGRTFDSSGPYAMTCLSGHGHNCHCSICPSIQHSASYPGLNSSQLKSLMESDRGRNTPTNDVNFNFRSEILAMNRQHIPSYTPNIQTDGSDNRTISCDRCGHSVIPKQEQSYIGPSSETYHSAGGASGMTDTCKDVMNDKRSIWEFTEKVMEMIRDSLDCADYYNWKKLADLHKWPFGKIYQLEQKWKNRKIESPFMHLIQEFQPYRLLDLKEDLRRIPRKDLLQKLEEFEMKGNLFHT